MKRRAVIQIKRDTEGQDAIRAMGERFKEAWNSGTAQQPETVITFSSPAQMFSVISPKRWELIEELQKHGPSGQRHLARLLGRDIKRVHDDVTLLSDWGIIEKNDDGKVLVPFDEIEADFVLSAVA